jgi:hypothetical protein
MHPCCVQLDSTILKPLPVKFHGLVACPSVIIIPAYGSYRIGLLRNVTELNTVVLFQVNLSTLSIARL